MTIENKYMKSLSEIPIPGHGCHAALLGVATLGIMAGRDDNSILSEIKHAIPHGTRIVSEREIMDAIHKARTDTMPISNNAPQQRPIPPPRRKKSIAVKLENPKNAEAVKSKLIEMGGDVDLFDADIWEASPIRIQAAEHLIDYEFSEDGLQLLRSLYRQDEFLYIGNQREGCEEQQKHVKTVSDWITFFQDQYSLIANMPKHKKMNAVQRLGNTYPFIIPNPLTGRLGSTKDGEKKTLRGDACIKDFRFMILESDSVPLAQQGALLRSVCSLLDCKICAVIFSGGKSCHAWIRVDGIHNLKEWGKAIKDEIFSVLGKIGFDGACCNSSRLSRFPGMFRSDKRNFQRLLYLAPEGGTI